MTNGLLNSFPDEIIQCILACATPISAVKLGQASKKFWSITNTPLLWRFYCRQYFEYWDDRHCILEKFALPVSLVDWKELYKLRHLIDVAVTELLESILACQTGRIEKFHKIISFGYDAKDTLLRHAEAGFEYQDHLARRYYSNAALGCLHRSIAISEWSRVRNGEDIPLERALGAFDLFVLEAGTGDLEDISQNLENIATRIEADFRTFRDLSPREKAVSIAVYLQDNNLTGIDPEREYYTIEHNFLGIALRDNRHNSLPLISAVIYCYIAKKLGLNAHPCGFPFHVHVIVRPEAGYDLDGKRLKDAEQGQPMFMDPFRSVQETPMSDLESQLNFLGPLALSHSSFLRESLPGEIILRCGKNILNSVTQTSLFRCTSLDLANVEYAALWALMLFADYARIERHPGQELRLHTPLRHHLPSLMEHFAANFPFDVYLVEEYLAPIFHGLPEYDQLKESTRVMKAGDEIPKQIRSTSDHTNIKYRVGQVFRHRRYNYVAVIIGWDPECGAREEWMQQMGIDRLRAGRHQSFYHVCVEDKSVRYVAEENIEPVVLDISQMPQQFVESLGKYFKRWDPGMHRFVSNIQDEYPDD
ncbi:hemimethylated DNA binding domain-containing protein [Coccidioides immitis RS]|uniref:Hemimethylated DNA binding domain-containing protein n=1 Tax=Coccidioides immitis (strain RS) TaxID=246410 RepID=J3KKR0_COCIM|nr:hemimethylated DNA binding domain-containing protein [Coccidioides immitis RS]EAS36782.3 hemimethylated DNA binding domain-containing protein [Coccidioides immitis RS]